MRGGGRVISGFKIRNANFEGILIVNATDVTVVGNHVLDNNKSLDIAGGTCRGCPRSKPTKAMTAAREFI